MTSTYICYFVSYDLWGENIAKATAAANVRSKLSKTWLHDGISLSNWIIDTYQWYQLRFRGLEPRVLQVAGRRYWGCDTSLLPSQERQYMGETLFWCTWRRNRAVKKASTSLNKADTDLM